MDAYPEGYPPMPSKPNDRTPQPGQRRIRERKPKRIAQWAEIDAEEIKAFVVAVTTDGSAALFGRTLDETTFTIIVYAGKDTIRKYVQNAQDVPDTFLDILDELEDTVPDFVKSARELPKN